MKNAAQVPTSRLDVEHGSNLLSGIHEVVARAVPLIFNQVNPLNLPAQTSQQTACFFRPQAANMIDHGPLVLATQR